MPRPPIASAMLAAAFAFVTATAGAAFAQGYSSGPWGPRPEGPQVYGPGSYTENGRTVWVPPGCYVSREQRLMGGRLVWVPLVTCTSNDSW